MNDSRTAADSPPPLAIWNPNAAANWSLIFTPAFGAYLHMLNWRALGEPERAARSRIWVFVSVAVFLAIVPLTLVLGRETVDFPARLMSLALLFAWYFASARAQARYVKEKFGEGYERREWGKPLGAGAAILFGYFVVSFVSGMIFGLLT